MSFSRGSFLILSAGGFHRIAYADWGKHSAAQVVVCVHGLSRNCRDFDYLARELAHDCRVVCPDVVGRGDSEWLADKGDYRFSTYRSDAAALIARITAPAPPVHMGILRGARRSADGPAQIDWVGTSMGGLIGMLLPPSAVRRSAAWCSTMSARSYIARNRPRPGPHELRSDRGSEGVPAALNRAGFR